MSIQEPANGYRLGLNRVRIVIMHHCVPYGDNLWLMIISRLTAAVVLYCSDGEIPRWRRCSSSAATSSSSTGVDRRPPRLVRPTGLASLPRDTSTASRVGHPATPPAQPRTTYWGVVSVVKRDRRASRSDGKQPETET